MSEWRKVEKVTSGAWNYLKNKGKFPFCFMNPSEPPSSKSNFVFEIPPKERFAPSFYVFYKQVLKKSYSAKKVVCAVWCFMRVRLAIVFLLQFSFFRYSSGCFMFSVFIWINFFVKAIHDVFNEKGKTLLVSKNSKTYPSRLQLEVLQYYKSIAWE